MELYIFKHDVVVYLLWNYCNALCGGVLWQSVNLMCCMLEVFALLEELLVELNVV